MPNPNTPDNEVAQPISFAPLALSLKSCNISIEELTAEPPDSDGDLRVTFNYKITNDTDLDWDYLSVNAQILTASGLVIDQYEYWDVATIGAGQSKQLPGRFMFPSKLLGNTLEKSHVVISFLASGVIQQALGQVEIPPAPFEVVSLNRANLSDTLQMVSGSVWTTAPDSQKYVTVEFKALIQNLSSHYFRQVWLDAVLKDKLREEMSDASNNTEIRPGEVGLVRAGTYVKAKDLKGAIADIKLRAYVPLAQGFAQRTGF